jgi:hypothetical protein
MLMVIATCPPYLLCDKAEWLLVLLECMLMLMATTSTSTTSNHGPVGAT